MPGSHLQIRLFLAIMLFAGPAFGGNAEISALVEDSSRIVSLEFEYLNNYGTASLIVAAVDEAGNASTAVDGDYPLKINGKSSYLTFHKGYATLSLDGARIKSMLVEYEGAEGPQRYYRVFRTFGTQTTASKLPLWVSIVPPLLAILLALIFREVVVSLLAGVFAGALLISSGGNILTAFTDLFEFYLMEALAKRSHVSIVLFTMMIGGMVAVISRNGGMNGVVDKLARLARTARSTQLVTWLLGIAVFFDDYANTLVVGNTMRPVTDRFRISREKLAYIVDSTAAPVASIAFITTWIGAELDYISDAIANTGIDESAYSIFLNSFAYAYYPILTLAFVFMLIWLRRDYGSMKSAEIRARTTGVLFNKEKDQSAEEESLQELQPAPGTKHLWYNAALPILTVIVVTMVGLWQTGYESMKVAREPYIGLFEKLSLWDQVLLVFSTDFLSVLIGASDSYAALLWASSMGLVVAVAMSLLTGTLGMRRAVSSATQGFKTMLPAIIILVLAWALAAITQYLQTASYLTVVFSDSLDIRWMPMVTFIMSALISFSTGSSWSTMAILYPLLLPLTWSVGLESGLEQAAIMPIFYNVTATVLAGSVFGDHCSPISDTTVLSSMACSCNHIDHVRTQLPYALTVGGVSVVAGGIMAPFGLPFFLNFALGLLALLAVIRFIGSPVPSFNGLSDTAVDDEGIKMDNQ